MPVATSYLLQVDTTLTPHDSTAAFRLESAITDLSGQEDRNSGFESKQEIVAVTVFCEAERGKPETLLKSELNFSTVLVDCCEVFTSYLP